MSFIYIWIRVYHPMVLYFSLHWRIFGFFQFTTSNLVSLSWNRLHMESNILGTKVLLTSGITETVICLYDTLWFQCGIVISKEQFSTLWERCNNFWFVKSHLPIHTRWITIQRTLSSDRYIHFETLIICMPYHFFIFPENFVQICDFFYLFIIYLLINYFLRGGGQIRHVSAIFINMSVFVCFHFSKYEFILNVIYGDIMVT